MITAAFATASASFDVRTVKNALTLAGAHGTDNLRAAITAIPGHQNVTITTDNAYPLATGLLSEYVRQLAEMWQREKSRADTAEAELQAAKLTATRTLDLAGQYIEDMEGNGNAARAGQ